MILPLVTTDERARLLAHGAALAAGQHLDPLPWVLLFTPDAHLTWLLVSLDPVDGDTAYGLTDLTIAAVMAIVIVLALGAADNVIYHVSLSISEKIVMTRNNR